MRQPRLTVVPAVLLACGLTGCGTSEPPTRTSPAGNIREYQDLVRAGVLKRIGSPGQPVGSRDEMVGSWDVAPVPLLCDAPPCPTFVYHFHADGSSITEVSFDGQAHRDTGRWQWHSDGTISLVTNISPGPSVPGLEQPGGEEEMLFLLGLPDGRRVIWNGDGSLVLLLTRRQSP